MIGLAVAGIAVVLTLLLAPWNWMPTEYAEEITVIAVTDYDVLANPRWVTQS